MTEKLYVLRDLPGVAALEAEALRWDADKNRQWSKEFDGLNDRVETLCRSLAGLTRGEASEVPWLDGDTDATWDERRHAYEAHFAFLDDEDDTVVIAELRKLGWDVRNTDGEVLSCLYWLIHPIVAAAKGLRGRLPDAPRSDAEIARGVEAFADRMLDEVEAFKRRKR